MFYKNINEYAEKNNICRQVASKYIMSGTANIIHIPKGQKFIDVEQLLIHYFENKGKEKKQNYLVKNGD